MKPCLLFLFFIVSSIGNSQSKKVFSFQLSGGPHVYFNNLENFNNNVNTLNYSAFTKLSWNAPYKLSFGIESGYIRMYYVSDFFNSSNSNITMTAIPLHISVSMKLISKFYAAGSFGPSFILNDLTTGKDEQKTHGFSPADMSIAIGYKHIFKNNLFLGIESKFFYSSKSEDRILSLPLVFGANF